MNICVYGGSSGSIDKAFLDAGEALGAAMARRGHGLVFGGGTSGLMGAVARGVTAGGGACVGIVPSFFNVDGVLYDGCTELVYTDTMRQRKQLMEDRSDAFVMTPGGIGTFDEFFEILTLRHLGRHRKPIAVLNTAGYYDSLGALMDTVVRNRFMPRADLDLYRMFGGADALLDYLEREARRAP